MSDILASINNFFNYVKDLISDFGSLLHKLIILLGSALSYLKVFASIFPIWLTIPIFVLIAVCILYKVLGREGSS